MPTPAPSFRPAKCRNGNLGAESEIEYSGEDFSEVRQVVKPSLPVLLPFIRNSSLDRFSWYNDVKFGDYLQDNNLSDSCSQSGYSSLSAESNDEPSAGLARMRVIHRERNYQRSSSPAVPKISRNFKPSSSFKPSSYAKGDSHLSDSACTLAISARHGVECCSRQRYESWRRHMQSSRWVLAGISKHYFCILYSTSFTFSIISIAKMYTIKMLQISVMINSDIMSPEGDAANQCLLSSYSRLPFRPHALKLRYRAHLKLT